MLNNLVIFSEHFGIWDLWGKLFWDLGFEGSKIWDLRGQKNWDLAFEGSNN